jgi:hypothetical protein
MLRSSVDPRLLLGAPTAHAERLAYDVVTDEAHRQSKLYDAESLIRQNDSSLSGGKM